MYQDNGLNWSDVECVLGCELLTEVITNLSLLGYDAVFFGTFCRKLLPPS